MARKLKDTPDDFGSAGIGHNSEAVEENNRVQLISLMSRLNAADLEIDAAMMVVKEKRGERKKIIGLGKAAGYPAWELQRRQEEMDRSTHEMADQVAREERQRRWLGIITPEQLALLDAKNTPEEVVDASEWRSRGYKVGLMGGAGTLPDGMPSRYTQDFMEGHADGRKSYLLTLAKNAPKPKGAKAKDIAAEAERQLNEQLTETDIDKAARKLKADPAFMERSADEPFEMTNEEREAQTLRPSVQEAEEPVL